MRYLLAAIGNELVRLHPDTLVYNTHITRRTTNQWLVDVIVINGFPYIAQGDFRTGYRHGWYARLNPNLTEVLNETAQIDIPTNATLKMSAAPDGQHVYYIHNTMYCVKCNVNLEPVNVFGGSEEDAYPYAPAYHEGHGTAVGHLRDMICVDNPDALGEEFIYIGGRRSGAYYYYTAIYATDTETMVAPEGNFYHIGRTSSDIFRDVIEEFYLYVDNEVPYLFMAGDDATGKRMAKVRLTDPYTIFKGPDDLNSYIGSGDFGKSMFANGVLYSARDTFISTFNIDTLAKINTVDYSEEEPSFTHFRSLAYDSELDMLFAGTINGIIFAINPSNMEVQYYYSGSSSGAVRSMEMQEIPVLPPILNLSQINNKIRVDWEYDTE